MKILVTAFEPFGKETENPSMQILDRLPESIYGHTVIKLGLPVSFGRCHEVARGVIDRERPDCIIAIGQAGGRADISIERIAVNMAQARNPDNDGECPDNRPIDPDGPDAIFSSAPVDRLVQAVRVGGIPAHASNSAGTYVCNTLYYHLLSHYGHIPVCFVHVPYSLAQAIAKPATTPSMSVDTMTQAITLIAKAMKVQ